MYRSPRWPLLVIVALALVLAASLFIPVDLPDLLRWGAELAGHPLMVVAIVIGMAILMTFGLPGSMGFWLIAPFHPPWISVPLILAGSVAGAMGAYRVGDRLGDTWRPGRVARQVLKLLAQRSDLLTQCALRILPGFPHAFINLSAGVLRLPFRYFLLAAIIGLAVKWTVYAQAVHGMVSATQAETALGWRTMLPLAILAVLMGLGGLARRLWFKSPTTTPDAPNRRR